MQLNISKFELESFLLEHGFPVPTQVAMGDCHPSERTNVLPIETMAGVADIEGSKSQSLREQWVV